MFVFVDGDVGRADQRVALLKGMTNTIRLSAFCRMYACAPACTRGTTMWLPLTWRTLSCDGRR